MGDFCKKCTKDLGDENIRKNQIDKNIDTETLKLCVKKSNFNLC